MFLSVAINVYDLVLSLGHSATHRMTTRPSVGAEFHPLWQDQQRKELAGVFTPLYF